MASLASQTLGKEESGYYSPYTSTAHARVSKIIKAAARGVEPRNRLIGERERANLIVQRARIFCYIYIYAVKSAVPSSSLPSPTDIEVISVEVGINHDLVLCSIYVPPDSPVSLISSLVLYLSSLVSSYNRCIFAGDFNFPDISWSSLLGSSMSSNVFCEFIFDCNLTQHVTQPTHKKGNILDLVLTSPSVNIKHLSVNPQLLSEFSDHFIISFDVSFSPSANISKLLCVFDFSKTNFTDICSFLLDFDFSVCFYSRDIEFIWSTIKSVIFVAISLFVPKKISKQINEPKWFNSGIRHHHNCLRTMKKKYKRHPTPNRKLQIKQCETSLMSRIAQAKANYETNLIKSFNNNNSSAIYRYIRAITNQNAFHLLLPSEIEVLSRTITELAYSMSSFILYLQAAHSNFLH